MTDHDWDASYARSLGVFMNGGGLPERDNRGERVVDESFLLFCNAGAEAVDFTVPDEEYGEAWTVVLDTAGAPAGGENGEDRTVKAGAGLAIADRSVVLLRQQPT
jgi:glycogen operon protein